MIEIPGLSHIIDGLVHGTKWLFKYGRSKKILVVGQGRAGKTSLFHYLRKKIIFPCERNLSMTKVAGLEKMFDFKETAESGAEIEVEVRLARDLSGQSYPDEQAQWVIDDKPNILFVFVRFDQSIKNDESDINNVHYWLNEFFSEIADHPSSLRQLVRITFVVSRVDQAPSSEVDDRKKEFKQLITNAYETLPRKVRKSISHEIYFLQMCTCNGGCYKGIKSKINEMLAESFVKI